MTNSLTQENVRRLLTCKRQKRSLLNQPKFDVCIWGPFVEVQVKSRNWKSTSDSVCNYQTVDLFLNPSQTLSWTHERDRDREVLKGKWTGLTGNPEICSFWLLKESLNITVEPQLKLGGSLSFDNFLTIEYRKKIHSWEEVLVRRKQVRSHSNPVTTK